MSVAAASGAGAGPDPVAAVDAAAGDVMRALDGRTPDLALLFLGAAHTDAAAEAVAVLRDRLGAGVLLGTTAEGVVAGAAELERSDAVAVWAACLPGAQLHPLRFPPPAEAAGEHLTWPLLPPDTTVLLLLADPWFPADAFLAWADQAVPGLPVCGGIASGGSRNAVVLDGLVHHDGAVAVALAGDVRVRTLVSQGCRPIGTGYVVTRADRNLVQELGGAPPIDRIREAFAVADARDRDLMRHGLHVGIAIDEYAERLGRGDFLIRGVMGAQPETGAVAVGAAVELGQTVQFQVRDAVTADEDLRALLDDVRDEVSPAGALLFTCNGRGRRLFGQDDHDAALVHEALGGAPLAGCFAAGEFGPVGGRSHVHGFTASLLVFES